MQKINKEFLTMRVSPIINNNFQGNIENSKKHNNKNMLNQLKAKLFVASSTLYTICAFDKISDGFNSLTKTQKVERIAKWAAIISACSSLLVVVSSFSVTDFIQNLLSKSKEDKKQK